MGPKSTKNRSDSHHLVAFWVLKAPCCHVSSVSGLIFAGYSFAVTCMLARKGIGLDVGAQATGAECMFGYGIGIMIPLLLDRTSLRRLGYPQMHSSQTDTKRLSGPRETRLASHSSFVHRVTCVASPLPVDKCCRLLKPTAVAIQFWATWKGANQCSIARAHPKATDRHQVKTTKRLHARETKQVPHPSTTTLHQS